MAGDRRCDGLLADDHPMVLRAQARRGLQGSLKEKEPGPA
jgi:hypothetical protein